MKPVKHWSFMGTRKSICGCNIPKGRSHCTLDAKHVTCKKCQNTKLWRSWVITSFVTRIQKGN